VSDESGGPALVEAMVWNGFRVIDFRWESHWFLHGTSVRRQSCRYATLIAFLAAQYPDEEFCVTGNSGAAGEIGYALSTWGLENDIDVAVLTGGPPMTRLDYLCLAPPFWQELCPGLVPPGTLEAECPGVTPCSASPNPICTICPVTSAAALRADSILYVGADTTHPNTRIHFVFGREDCSLLRPMGPLYASVVTGDGPVQVEYVSGTPHAVYATQAGRTAILAALLGSG
jgi:hypothetical protein